MHRFKSVFLSSPLKSEDIYNLTTVILHTKCRCSRQKEIKDVVDEKQSAYSSERLRFCVRRENLKSSERTLLMRT